MNSPPLPPTPFDIWVKETYPIEKTFTASQPAYFTIMEQTKTSWSMDAAVQTIK